MKKQLIFFGLLVIVGFAVGQSFVQNNSGTTVLGSLTGQNLTNVNLWGQTTNQGSTRSIGKAMSSTLILDFSTGDVWTNTIATNTTCIISNVVPGHAKTLYFKSSTNATLTINGDNGSITWYPRTPTLTASNTDVYAISAELGVTNGYIIFQQPTYVKGDLLVATNTALLGTISAGSSNTYLRVNPTTASGLEYANPNAYDLTTTTTAFVLGSRYTNSSRIAFPAASFTLTAAVAGTAIVTLYVEHGTTITNKLTVSAGPLASLVTVEALSGLPVGPTDIFRFEDETSGSGATVAIVTGTSSLTKLP